MAEWLREILPVAQLKSTICQSSHITIFYEPSSSSMQPKQSVIIQLLRPLLLIPHAQDHPKLDLHGLVGQYLHGLLSFVDGGEGRHYRDSFGRTDPVEARIGVIDEGDVFGRANGYAIAINSRRFNDPLKKKKKGGRGWGCFLSMMS